MEIESFCRWSSPTTCPLTDGRCVTSMKVRFAVVMAIYAVLALLGAIMLTGKIRSALWIVLGGLAAKTMIVMAQRRGDE
jgi:hypothetical protein